MTTLAGLGLDMPKLDGAIFSQPCRAAEPVKLVILCMAGCALSGPRRHIDRKGRPLPSALEVMDDLKQSGRDDVDRLQQRKTRPTKADVQCLALVGGKSLWSRGRVVGRR